MKKLLFSFCIATSSLFANPEAVVFDWGNVIAFADRSTLVDFMCQTFKFSKSDFEQANQEKRKSGKSDIDFWLQFANKKGILLPIDWSNTYHTALKKSMGADPKMFALVDELKNKQIRVGLLSNINDRYKKLIEEFGFYEPFDPCLLSCEMGFEKPDPRTYELLLSTIGLKAEDVVFIDDKIENVNSAKRMGIDAIVFESESQVRHELTQRGLL